MCAVKATVDRKTAGFTAGDKLYQQQARIVMPILVRQAKAGQRIYYSDLAREVGMPNARNLASPLGAIGDEIERISKKWHVRIPPLECLVVNKLTKLPGRGIAKFFANPDGFLKSSNAEKEQLLEMSLAKVFTFSQWDELLSELGLRPVQTPVIVLQGTNRSGGMGGGGESDLHRNLKTYVAKHPEVVGLPRSAAPGRIEVELRSGDQIDVLFDVGRLRVGVEVKGPESDINDIQRGLFQCVKYKAVIEAEQKMQQIAVRADAILVLGSGLPPALLGLKHLLGVEVVEEVKVPRFASARA
jgi:hypothetical protein